MRRRTMAWLVAPLLALASLPVAAADNPSAAPPSAILDEFQADTEEMVGALGEDAAAFGDAVTGNASAAVATALGGDPPATEAQNIVTAATDAEDGFVPSAQATTTAYAMDSAAPTALLVADHANDTAFAILEGIDAVVDVAASGGRLVVNQTLAQLCSNPVDPTACEEDSLAGIVAFQVQETSTDAFLFAQAVDSEALAAEVRAALDDIIGPVG